MDSHLAQRPPARAGGHRRRRALLAQLQGQRLLNAFIPLCAAILVAGMVVTSWWLSSQIETNVIRQTTTINALYIESIIAPTLGDAALSQALTAEQARALDRTLAGTPIAREVVAYVVWGRDGRVLYSSEPSQIGRQYPVDGSLAKAWANQIAWELDEPEEVEPIPDRLRSTLLLATYAPVHRPGDDTIVAVAEIYQRGSPLVTSIQSAQRTTWVVVGVVTLLMALVLLAFIRIAATTVGRQEEELSAQVAQLVRLADENAELHERARRATRRVALLHERLLRRISAELHDGPAQYLSLALLHIDRIWDERAEVPPNSHHEVAQSSVAQALNDLRAIAAGMGLPQIERLSLADAVARAVQAHERATGTTVDLECAGLPAQVSPDCKLTLYRVLQESLRNAHRHAGGRGQEVHVWREGRMLVAEIGDRGPGMPPADARADDERMGVSGMRERVEALGGDFLIESEPGRGTRVRARIPLDEELEP